MGAIKKQFTFDEISQAVASVDSWGKLHKLLGYKGKNFNSSRYWVKKYGLDTSHFVGYANQTHTKYTKELLEHAVSKSLNYADVARHFGLNRNNATYVAKLVKDYEIDISHFDSGAAYRGMRLDPDKVLVLSDKRAKTYSLRVALDAKGMAYECAICGLGPWWNGKILVLHIDHIDGNALDSRIDNLRYLCPNCHYQQETTGGRNKNRYPTSRKI